MFFKKSTKQSEDSKPSSRPFVGPPVQLKLKIGESNDQYEQEADRVADKVVNKSKGDAVQKKEGDEEIQQKPIANEVTPLVQKMESTEEPVQKMAEEEPVQKKEESEEPVQMMAEEEPVQKVAEEEAVQKAEEEEAVQKKDAVEEEPIQKVAEEEAVQKKEASSRTASPSIESRLNSSKGGGQKLTGRTKHEMESGFGNDFSDVSIHTDQNAAQMSQEMGAKAFAHGNDVYFNKGQYKPETSEGKHLLAHELTHTIQQKGMVQKKVQKQDQPNTDDKSVLKITKFPWNGTISTNGNSDVGFHKEPRPSTDKSSNIWPSFMDGDSVTVLSKTSTNWFKVKRTVNGKEETGYIDWRYVKSDSQLKSEKGDKIKKRYFQLVDKGEGYYLDAIRYLIKVYNIDASHATLSYNSSITGAYAVTGGRPGDKSVPVEFGPPCFDKNEDFGILSRVIAHELLHSEQKVVDVMLDHNEREFLAYYDTVARTDMPEIKDLATLKFFLEKALNYYKKLPQDKQLMYVNKKLGIDQIKLKHGF